MNWAMPCAPAGLTTAGLKLLSCQIRLAKNGTGRSLARATETMALHTLARDIAARRADADIDRRVVRRVEGVGLIGIAAVGVDQRARSPTSGSGVTGWLAE